MALDERVKDIQLLAQGAAWLRGWVGQSKPKFFIAFCIVLAVPVATVYGYISYLLYVTGEQTTAYVHELRYTSETDSYKSAIDIIASCLDSTQDSKELHGWYCSQAVLKYRDVSPKIKPVIDRVDDVAKRTAYRAMLNDVKGYLRNKRLQQEIQSRPTNAKKILSVTLSGTIEALLILVIIAEGLGVFWFFRVHRSRVEN